MQVKFAVDQARKACAAAPGLAALLPEEAALPGLLGCRLQVGGRGMRGDVGGNVGRRVGSRVFWAFGTNGAQAAVPAHAHMFSPASAQHCSPACNMPGALTGAPPSRALGHPTLARLPPLSAPPLGGIPLPTPVPPHPLQDITQAVYVDAAGRQQPVAPEELDSCYLDPLALTQHDLLAELNNSPAWQAQLRLFCAAYLGVHAGEVLLTEADRMGFTLLGAPQAAAGSAAGEAAGGGAATAPPQQQQQHEQQAGAQEQQAQQQRWRQFRIGSARELRSRAAFMELLEQMRAEVAAAAGAA